MYFDHEKNFRPFIAECTVYCELSVQSVLIAEMYHFVKTWGLEMYTVHLDFFFFEIVISDAYSQCASLLSRHQ